MILIQKTHHGDRDWVSAQLAAEKMGYTFTSCSEEGTLMSSFQTPKGSLAPGCEISWKLMRS